MIVTFDTTILVRAIGRMAGPAREALRLVVEHPDHELVLSPFILNEVGKVLAYPRLWERYKLTPEDVYDYATTFVPFRG